LMPMPAAVAASSTPARTMAPIRLRSRNHHSSAATTAPNSTRNTRYLGSIVSPSANTPARASGGAMLRMSGPHRYLQISPNTKMKPKVSNTWSRCGRLYIGRMKRRSIMTAAATAGTQPTASANQKLPDHCASVNAVNEPIMKNEPCARLTTFIRPNVNDRPADIMNSSMPNTRLFNSCVIRKSIAPSNTDRRTPAQPGRRAGRGRSGGALGRVGDVFHGVDHLIGNAPVDFRHFAYIDVVDRALALGIEAEGPARRGQLHFQHGLAQLFLVGCVAVYGFQRGVDDARRHVAVLGIHAGILVVRLAVAGHEFLVGFVIQRIGIMQRVAHAQRRGALRRQSVAVQHEPGARHGHGLFQPVLVVLLDEAHGVGTRVEAEGRRRVDVADVGKIGAEVVVAQ